jgi:hypothetical protein
MVISEVVTLFFYIISIAFLEISREKVAAVVKPSKVDAAIEVIIQEFLDRDGFKYMACGLREGHEEARLIGIYKKRFACSS